MLKSHKHLNKFTYKILIYLLFLILTSWLSRLVQSSKSNSFLHETVFSIIANNKTAPLLCSVFWLEFSIEEVSRSILNGLSKEIYRPISIKKQDSMTLLVVGLWCSWLATRWKPFFIKNWFCCSWVHLNFYLFVIHIFYWITNLIYQTLFLFVDHTSNLKIIQILLIKTYSFWCNSIVSFSKKKIFYIYNDKF